jgi:oxygen-dependent protoporphyrinogen oxidase
MPGFLELERRDRSLILGMRRPARAAARRESGARWSLFASFEDGMQTLIDALAQRLPEGALRVATHVSELTPRGDGGWRLALGDGSSLEADGVVLATPSFVSAELLRPLDRGLADLLAGIEHASSVIVTLAYARAEVPHPLDGFGFVVPAIEGRMAIAGSFSSVKYHGRAPAGQVLVRVFMGGALAPQTVDLDDAALLDAARRELGDLLDIAAAPVLVRVQRHRRAMPQYAVGHLERVAAIESGAARLGALAVAGSAYRGVGVPDCIHSGERAVDDLLARVLQAPR